jgi:hypothetical protein
VNVVGATRARLSDCHDGRQSWLGKQGRTQQLLIVEQHPLLRVSWVIAKPLKNQGGRYGFERKVTAEVLSVLHKYTEGVRVRNSYFLVSAACE